MCRYADKVKDRYHTEELASTRIKDFAELLEEAKAAADARTVVVDDD